MRKIVGIGETVLDIIFRDDQPFRAVPGGSVFNCMVSLGRCNLPSYFISEVGDDRVGRLIRNFMQENNLSTRYIDFFQDGHTPVAMAFLNEQQDAEYVFYKNFPEKRLDVDFPEIREDDIVVLSSYFAVNPVLRERVLELLKVAREQRALVYYDINFRKAHAHERLKLTAQFLENFEYASIVRCSDEDLETLFPGKTIDEIYRDHISFYCKHFIVTQGNGDVLLKSGTLNKTYKVEPLTPVSTIGAGDNFNAGMIYGLMKHDLLFRHLDRLDDRDWDQLIPLAIQFAREACLSQENYVSREFAGTQRAIGI